MRLGIDFGTTNSAIALYDRGNLVSIPLDMENENSDVLPSLIYVNREHENLTGMAAAHAFLEGETGRQVKWAKRQVGSVEMIVGGKGSSPIRYIQDLHALVDISATGRLLQSVKTILRNPFYDGTRIFDRFYTLDSLIVLLIARLKEQAEVALGQPCDSIILGRPVKFSDDPGTDRRAEEILYKAAYRAGFRDITFAQEPLAVAHLQHVSSPERQRALVFDFGGGTLDLTIAELGGAGEPNIIATQGVLVGGDDLDKAIMRHLTKYFGKGVTVGRERYRFPYDMLDLLGAWQTMPDLSQAHNIGRIREFQKRSSNPRAMKALEHLVSRNLGYPLFREIERVKKELSTSIFSKLTFVDGPIRINELITREQFNKLIATEIDSVRAGIDAVLAQAEMTPDQIDVVLRTGGSSIIPAFRDMLIDMFGAEKLKDLEPMVSVVGGMAVIAETTPSNPPQYALRYQAVEKTMDSITVQGDYAVFSLQVGEASYTDDDFIISRCPAILSMLPALRLPNRDESAMDSDTYIQFELKVPAYVYVAYDPMVTRRPDWLEGFEAMDMQIEVQEDWRGERALRIFSKLYQPGTVTLGGLKATGFHTGFPPLNYMVVVQADV